MGSESRSAPTHSALLVPTVLLALAVIAKGWVGARYGIHHPDLTVTWSSIGLAYPALIYFGPRLWPGVFVGVLVLGFVAGITPPVAIALAAGSTLAPVVGAILLRRFVDFDPSLERVRDVVLMLFVAGMLTAIVFAVAGAATFWLAGELATGQIPHSLLVWWRAGFGPIISMSPFFLLLATGHPRWSDLLTRREFWAVESLLLASCYFAFSGVAAPELQALTTPAPVLLIFWSASRLGTRGAIVVALQTLMLAGKATRAGVGPFFADDPVDSLAQLWVYAAAIGTMAPLAAAAFAQRDLANATRSQSERDRLLMAQREGIMREVHDGLGGQLVSVLSMVQRGKASPTEIAEGLRRALDDMRIMIDSLETTRDGLPILLGKLRARIEPVLKRNGLRLVWRVEPGTDLDGLDPERSLHCLRIVQEAVTNAIRHARASQIEVVIRPGRSDGSGVSIEVSDDGVVGPPTPPPDGRGMRNMIDRAREIGADLRFETREPGVRVMLTVPTIRPTD